MINLEDFMCVCTDEPRAEAEACVERVLADLKTTPGELLSAVVFALEHGLPDGYYGSIEGIACDQWCAVSAQVSKSIEGKYEKHAGIFIQCDLVEQGVARVWELAKEAATEPDVEPSLTSGE